MGTRICPRNKEFKLTESAVLFDSGHFMKCKDQRQKLGEGDLHAYQISHRAQADSYLDDKHVPLAVPPEMFTSVPSD